MPDKDPVADLWDDAEKDEEESMNDMMILACVFALVMVLCVVTQ